jgi:hypothetical protein
MLGYHRRRVLRCEWDTKSPNPIVRPVAWQRAGIPLLYATQLLEIIFDKICGRTVP